MTVHGRRCQLYMLVVILSFLMDIAQINTLQNVYSMLQYQCGSFLSVL